MPGNFTLNDKFSTQHTLKCLDAHKGSKMLGVFVAINGNQTNQLNNLREKSKFLAKNIATQILSSTPITAALSRV